MDYDYLINNLPTGVQSFEWLRSTNRNYADKTAYVYKIAKKTVPMVLSRPRRFGKSTLLSTLEELFLHGVKPYDGHDSYFKGLWIENKWTDNKQYLVLHLNFAHLNQLCRTVEQFERKLMQAYDKFASAHGISLPEDSIDVADKFSALLEKVPNGSLVLLIDEHDSVLLSHLNNEDEKAQATAILSSIYDAVKFYSQKFRCVFTTGITRFHDLQLGSAGNSMTDISFDSDFGACCGYTREELKLYFADNLRAAAAIRTKCDFAEVSDVQIEALLDEMAEWYDGFCFDSDCSTQVFSTWSVLRFFSDKHAKLSAYWVAEESISMPQLLKATVGRVNLESLLEEYRTGEFILSFGDFKQASLSNPEANPYALLYQSGYLTLAAPFDIESIVRLKRPNKELNWAFANLVAERLYRVREFFNNQYRAHIAAVLASLDPKRINAYFVELFKTLPYEGHPIDKESMVADLIFFNLNGAGLQPQMEVSENVGRPDMVVDLPHAGVSLVFEFKYESSADAGKLDAKLNEAAAQIKAKDYGHSISRQQRIGRFAVVFCGDPAVRNIARCTLVDVQER